MARYVAGSYTWVVDADAEEVRDVLVSAILTRPDVDIREVQTHLMVLQAYRKPWRWIVGILLFPVGLLAIAGRDHHRATLHVSEEEQGASVDLGGVWDNRLLEVVLSMLATFDQVVDDDREPDPTP